MNICRRIEMEMNFIKKKHCLKNCYKQFRNKLRQDTESEKEEYHRQEFETYKRDK